MLKDMAEIFGVIMPFLFAAVIVLGVLHFRYLRRLETEKTIRMAIEHGQQLDGQLIEKLMEPQRKQAGPEKLRVGGTIVLFVGLGLAALGVIKRGFGDIDYSVLGAGALVGLVGAGILLASYIAKKPNTP
jgi:hypothetical protein